LLGTRTWLAYEEKELMNLQGLIDDVKGRVREVKDRGPRAGVQGLVEDMTGRVKSVIGRVTGRREDDVVRIGETKAAADERAARETGKTDLARASAATKATKQRAKKA
jgi:hypothetical protein